MKIDFSQELKDLSGEAIHQNAFQDEKLEIATLGSVSVSALLYSYNDETPSGEEKFKRYQIAEKIHGSEGVIDIPIEEVGLIKQLIGKAYAPVVVGSAYKILES